MCHLLKYLQSMGEVYHCYVLHHQQIPPEQCNRLSNELKVAFLTTSTHVNPLVIYRQQQLTVKIHIRHTFRLSGGEDTLLDF